MTDPTGPCFLSYKRERATEAAMLVAALADRGVPVWQDVSDLPAALTETALEAVLADPATSGAVMLVTKEVASSDVIRNVEVPAILRRARAGDRFYAVPIAAGGLDYADVGGTLGPMTGLVDMSGYNIVKATADPFDAGFAKVVARRVLRERLAACLAAAAPDAELRLQVSTRTPLPKEPGHELRMDLTARFDRRHAQRGAWDDAIIPALADVGAEIARRAPSRRVTVSGYPSLAAAVVLGAAFPSVGVVRATWMQEQAKFGLQPMRFGLDEADEPSGFVVDQVPRSAGGTDVALLVSVTNDVVHDFSLSAGALSLRAVVHVAPPDPRPERVLLGPGAARNLACQAIDALRAAVGRTGARGTVHLFLAVPAAVAFMIGQQLNTLGRVQTYEHDPAAAVPYVPAALLTAST